MESFVGFFVSFNMQHFITETYPGIIYLKFCLMYTIHDTSPVTYLPITRMRNRDQYRMSIGRVSRLALEESKMNIFSSI